MYGPALTYGPVTTRAPFAGAAARDDPDRRVAVPPLDRGRDADRSGSSTVPFEQIGQSAVKRLWRQKSEVMERALNLPGVVALPTSARPMLTAVVSDIHLGKAAGTDLVQLPAVRERLLETIARADRLVLLGDAVELRESPLADAMTAAKPFFQALGEAFTGKPVTIVPGNHDYQLATPLLEAKASDPDAPPLGLADTATPPDGAGALGRIAAWAKPAEVELSYPGTWIRDDVYATHGHYMDWHGTVPTLEILSIGIAERVVRHRSRIADRMTPADYEAALAPVYELAHALAQSARHDRQLAGGGRSARMWQRLNGEHDGSLRNRAEAALASAAVQATVGALNRLGLGPLSPELSATELRRAGLRSMAASIDALGVDARHVVFGHTHRSGPWPRDHEGWNLPNGGRLTNSGSWIYEKVWLGDRPNDNPYLPGVVVWVEDEGDPRPERLLDPDDVERAISRT
jgi:predicted phosphodiesterase